MEKYYGNKASELDPTGDRATKCQKQQFKEMEDDLRKRKQMKTDRFDQELNQENNELVQNRLINRIWKLKKIDGCAK
ncbi:MAG: hypothetical protein EZS28_014526 [Streblomastix strix]|uniref:Uncharacterized protein n=1 Tax=Streblomastix strix TaxID=222440 RepID=A0A5J4W502_9EUKA|nr:MAG: hypothetical protein EZS28_014526 [Streblomastix strix]